jgi:MFS family permease
VQELVEKEQTGWLTLIIITLSLFTIVIDKTFMNVAISTLIRELHTNIGTIQIIIAVYALIMASLMLFGGKLQKVLGRRRTFVTGASIYGLGTIVAALSINSTMLFIGWSVLEGVGAALMMPASTSIVTGSYEGERRVFALGITSSMASGAGSLGPIIGGFLTTYYSWRYAFGLEFIIIAAILIGSGRVSKFPATMNWSEIDIKGALTSSAGILILVLGILMFNNPKTWSIAPYLIAGGVVLLGIFYINQKKLIEHGKTPLLDVTLFKNRSFTLGNLARILMNFIMGAVPFAIPVFVQGALGADPLATGLTLLPMSIAIFGTSTLAGKISKRMDPRYTISAGFLSAIAGILYLSSTFSVYTTIMDMMPGLILLGIGMGIVFPHTTSVIFSVARHDQQPDASGVLNTGINLGSSIGTAVIGVILILGSFSGLGITEHTQSSAAPQQELKMDAGFFVDTSISSVQNINDPTVMASSMKKVKTMKNAFNTMIIILLLGLLTSIMIPVKRSVQRL